MRSASGRLLAAALCLFTLVSIVLYNSLETRSTEHRQNYESSEKELERLEQEVQNLEAELKNNGRLMNGMLQKVRQGRRKLESPERNTPKTGVNKSRVDPGGDKIGGAGARADGGVGFLLPPKKPEQIRREELNAEQAAEQKAQEEQAIHGVIHPPEHQEKIGGKVAIVREFLDRVSPHPDSICYAGLSMTLPSGNIQMLDVYSILPFDDPDGGVWKQGFDITYSIGSVQREPKLEVIVVPHSHTDPGWIKTFENYYETQTRNILNNMFIHLLLMDEMRFVYAEMSFFERWWAEIDEKQRVSVKKLLKSGKLEILTGGWVMTDEANSHYFAIISQLIEGHEWIRNHIGEDYNPRNHWSIDPFGLSPTITYFMRKSNFSNGVIQRVHYSVKKYLAERKQLEFIWRQLWGGDSSSTDFTTHVMPFFSYDVPHTCGPDPKICCQFDFRRLPGGDIDCPWKAPAEEITDQNVAQRAALLYDQYRKKAQLFKTNVVLVPLGDDFRYDTQLEWSNQFNNYMKLFKYMNEQTSWNVNARFGTVDDYFKLVGERLQEEDSSLPVLSGDFFTYADRNDHYWSGYYTSRPYYKRLDRVLEHYVRTAEFLYSSMKIEGAMESETELELFGSIVEARRYMSLFQHHDGITGTSKDEVMADYGHKMFTALKNCERVILSATDFLLLNRAGNPSSHQELNMEESRLGYDSPPEKRIAMSNNEVIVFNSLGKKTGKVICVHVSSLNTVILHASEPDNAVPQQIGPVVQFVNGHWNISSELFELCFYTVVPALSFQKYLIKSGLPHHKAKIRLSFNGLQNSDFEIVPLGDFVFDNGFLSAAFDPATGHLKSVSLKEGKEVAVNMSFVGYEARLKSPVPLLGTDDPPGAYLFLPKGPAKPLKTKNIFVAIDGIVMQKVLIAENGRINFIHVIKLPMLSPSIEVENTVNLDSTRNFEMAMRLETGVDNGDEFFTDLNGFQMIKRRRFGKLPLQAQFYPMSASAFIEDSSLRMTLLTAQPLGVANLASGHLDVMLDRHLDQDDGRGLLSGVTDNRETTSFFSLLFEVMDNQAPLNTKAQVTAYHSLTAHDAMLSLLYPPVVILANEDNDRASDYAVMKSEFPCDVHPVTLRTLAAPTLYGPKSTRIHSAQNSYALVLHRFGIDCRLKTKFPKICDAKVDLTNVFKTPPSHISETSLTLLYNYSSKVDIVKMEPMEVRTFRLDYT